MAITYNRVPLVESGDPITSTHWNNLAERMNQGIRGGLGDPAFRIMYTNFTAFRQVRNPDETGNLWPPEAEYFTTYQGIDPEEFNWPTQGPGLPEGANVSSLWPGFVFGVDAVGLEAEDERVAGVNGVPLWFGPTEPTAEELWELGKQQRGAVDPNTGYYGAPALNAAIQHYKINRPYSTSPHGNSYGGYMPAPLYLGQCTDPEFANYEIKFTSLVDGTVRTYSGTCPENPTDVAYIGRGIRAYYVYLNDGTVDVLPVSEWIEGPYTGGAWVTKQAANYLPRALNAFADEFRGTDEQREEQETWLQHAFDTERFLTSQYHLSPQIGSGDAFGVGPHYPVWTYAASAGLNRSAGDPIFKSDGQETHFYASGFVFASIFIKAQGLGAATSIKLYVNGQTYRTIAISPDNAGNFQTIITMENPERANPLAIEWGADAQFLNSSGSIRIEATELMEYKPELFDLYLCLRLGSCRTNFHRGVDGVGIHEERANEISDAYFENGMMTNVRSDPGPAGSFDVINTNAVFDAARRLSKCVRIVPRVNFIGYEVTGGKSVCYFLRRTLGGQDIFDGIGPSRLQITSGAIRADRQYTVRTGSITYRNVNYFEGDVFTGAHGSTGFVGTGEVYEYNGIRATAEREGETNEWVMGHQLKVYHPSDSSIWKADAYTDYWFLGERCHFDYQGLPTALRWQFQNSNEPFIFKPEAPTGWRYAMNTNSFPCVAGDVACEAARVDRYKSCRIYEPDPEIESATVLIEGGQEVVKLVFKTRFHNHASAPGAIARDVSTWNVTDLRAESYRTFENGLREYLVWAHQGINCVKGGASLATGQQGNAAANTTIWSNPDDPYGACFPQFFFVKLIPKVYEDSNTTQDDHDTPLLADRWKLLEMYIRALCEGNVDGMTSVSVGCETGISALFDYTFESLCFEAFGGRWFGTLGSQTTEYLEEDQIREDRPEGFGPLTNTTPAAEVYNQFAAALNLMNRYRVMLPMQFEELVSTGSAVHPVAATTADGSTPLPCTTIGSAAGYWSGTPPDPGAGTPGAWTSAIGASSTVSAGFDCTACDGDNWLLGVSRQNAQWRWSFIDPDAINAIPDHWQDMALDPASFAVLGVRIRQIVQRRVVKVSDIADAQECPPVSGHWNDGTNYLKFEDIVLEDSATCEIIPGSGTVAVQSLGQCEIQVGLSGGVTCCGGVQNVEGFTAILGDDLAFMEVPLV